MVDEAKERNMNYIGITHIAEGVGKPISSEICVVYKGADLEKKEQAKKLQKAISGRLADLNKSIFAYETMCISCGGKETYTGECETELRISAHEEWHSEVDKQGYTNYPAYSEAGLSMLDESSAYAVGTYTALTMGKQEQSQKCVDVDKDYRKFCRNYRTLYERALATGEVSEGLIEDIADFQKEYDKSDRLNEYNWATFLFQINNLALYEPCMNILEEYGLEAGKEIILDSFEMAIRKRSLDGAADCLGAFLPKEKQNILAPHYEIVNLVPPLNRDEIHGIEILRGGIEDYIPKIIMDSVDEVFSYGG
ncbi:MAG: hypothetical protein KAU95_02705 [Candidatus Aenigmarchaeota archaeon]|nr:hypothetical protein [Candidatus Aenigmarchaeota archaeon]